MSLPSLTSEMVTWFGAITMPDVNKNTNTPFVEVRNVVKHFPITGGMFMREIASVKAVDGVSLEIRPGDTLGLVGESGCGKSTLGRLILRLEEPTGGDVLFRGESILGYGREKMRALRQQMQIIFQDPFSSLNPRKNVAHIVGEPLFVHGMINRHEREARVLELLHVVGLKRGHQSDLGKVIGKQGRTARAIRTILAAAGMKQRRRYNLEIIERFEEE